MEHPLRTMQAVLTCKLVTAMRPWIRRYEHITITKVNVGQALRWRAVWATTLTAPLQIAKFSLSNIILISCAWFEVRSYACISTFSPWSWSESITAARDILNCGALDVIQRRPLWGVRMRYGANTIRGYPSSRHQK
jgi:hypothetical protein